MHITCPQCSKRVRVDRELAGKRGRCSECGAEIEIPAITDGVGDEYELSGTLTSGASISFTLRAADAHAAAEAAKAQGVKVKSVMPRGALPHGMPAGKEAHVVGADIWRQPGDDPADESITWTGTPSQWTNVHIFLFFGLLLGVLVIPLIYAIWCYIVVRCTRYELTTQRLRLITGVFSKHVDEVELYRVRDTTLIQPFLQRIVRLGTIVVISSDATDPQITIHAIARPREVREQLRSLVERRRRITRARSLEMD